MREDIIVETAYGFNHLVVENEGIYIEDADCKDKICLQEGIIKKAGEILVCLPHRLLVEIKVQQS